jgi:hypothetical protein
MPQRFAPLGFLALAALLAAVPSDTADARKTTEPMRFFEGGTEMVSVVKVVMKKPYRSRTIGQGHMLPDGTLSLVQQVHEAGKPTQRRHWRIKQTDSDSFQGTMSEAVGPVQVEEINDDFRFKFKMKGNLVVEQWVTPLADGKSARTRMTVRKLGMRVATSEGVIRRI